MKTLLDFRYHQDPKVFRLGELPPRAYMIPFDCMSMLHAPREESPFFRLLSGEWKFLWKPSVYEMDDFFSEDFDLSEFETVMVPEMWQTHGKDYLQYQSSPYPFHANPPFVPEKNPCAAYVKEFSAEVRDGKRYELHFEGKDSCVYVFLNGTFVGYGESPHNDSAFDVTPYIRNGKNRLSVLVLKWCSGTYLDDQDKIRLSGLFRDVYLLERAADGLTDFTVTATLDGKVSLSCEAKSPVTAELYDGETLLYRGDAKDFCIDAPHLWSAEDPYLYSLVLTCAGEYILQKIGFRACAVIGRVFTLNGKHIKLYGVNRHDSTPDTGYVTSYEFMKQELILMKQHNINAIRTSHYTNDPRFYQLCDELGFYVMSEADLECHGFTYLKHWDKITNDPMYAEMYHDRILRMYAAFKNAASIVIWSLGNESSWGTNLENEALWLKATDKTRPVHYEGALVGFFERPEEEQRRIMDIVDFASKMYFRFERIEEYRNSDTVTKPFLLCEYSHAMGNSCGDLRFYDDLFQTSDWFAGGFIWEWCDHAIRIKDENGVPFFGYGGDFGEHHHLRNVCMDGLVAPDRRPHSSLLEAKAVFAPIRVTRNEDGTFTVRNRHAFSDLSRYSLCFSIALNGIETQRGVLDVSVLPGEAASLSIPLCEPYAAEDAVLTVTLVRKAETLYAPAGHTVAAFSFPLTVKETAAKPAACPPLLEETRLYYTVSGKTESGKAFRYTFRKDSGELISLTVEGEELFEAPMRKNAFRAPTDNDYSLSHDKNVGVFWASHRHYGNIEYSETELYGFRAEMLQDAVSLSASFLFGAQGRIPLTRGDITFTVDGRGKLTISENSTVDGALPYFLPRYGYLFTLKQPTAISYFGYGPSECYEDKCSCATLGHYDYVIDDPQCVYEKPQECGSHFGTSKLTLQSGNAVLTVRGEPFSFSASHYDIHDVTAAKHQKDLFPKDATFLSVDFRMSGVGSASCGGQQPLPQCRINAGDTFCRSISIEIE